MKRKNFLKGLFGIGFISTIPISLQAISKEKSDIDEDNIIGISIIYNLSGQRRFYDKDCNQHGPWKLYIPISAKGLLNKLFYLHDLDTHKITIMEALNGMLRYDIYKEYKIEKVIISNKFGNRHFRLMPVSINSVNEYWDYCLKID